MSFFKNQEYKIKQKSSSLALEAYDFSIENFSETARENRLDRAQRYRERDRETSHGTFEFYRTLS